MVKEIHFDTLLRTTPQQGLEQPAGTLGVAPAGAPAAAGGASGGGGGVVWCPAGTGCLAGTNGGAAGGTSSGGVAGLAAELSVAAAESAVMQA